MVVRRSLEVREPEPAFHLPSSNLTNTLRYTKRPYTAEQIVNKRGTIKQEYPNNQMSKKLWNILEEKFKVSEERGKPWHIEEQR